MHFELLLGLFCRCFGFFLFSPLFSRVPIPRLARFGISLSVACLLAPLIQIPTHSLPTYGGLFFVFLAKEGMVGYLLGTLFSLILESAALAGQMIGTLAGFSATELLDPGSSSPYPLWSKVCTFFIGVLIFTFDLHHEMLKILYESFSAFPISGSLFTEGVIEGILEAVQNFFQFALQYAAFPLLILGGVILLLGIGARMLPDFPIFWVGLPIQILIGMAIFILGIAYFAVPLHQAFLATRHVIERIFLTVQ